jgi:hypothetical protein
MVLIASPCEMEMIAMKTIISTLIALSFLSYIAGPAAALEAKTFYDQQDHARF